MTDIYALIWSDGSLEFRSGDVRRIWESVSRDPGTCSEFAIQHASSHSDGLRGFVSRLPGPEGEPYPVNRVAGPVVAALGGPDGDWFGTMAVCGCDPAGGGSKLRGLSPFQQRLIRGVHAAAWAEVHMSHPVVRGPAAPRAEPSGTEEPR